MNSTEKNLALIAGITIPIVLVIFFSVAMILIKGATQPPEYDFLYMTGPYPQVIIDANTVSINYRVDENKSPRLYVYHVRTNQSEEIVIDLSKATPLENKMSRVNILNLSNFKVDKNNKAPDGYVFHYNYRMRSFPYDKENTSRYMISKNGNNIMINAPEDLIHFVGWIIPIVKGVG